jgi:hypothetical protein
VNLIIDFRRKLQLPCTWKRLKYIPLSNLHFYYICRIFNETTCPLSRTLKAHEYSSGSLNHMQWKIRELDFCPKPCDPLCYLSNISNLCCPRCSVYIDLHLLAPCWGWISKLPQHCTKVDLLMLGQLITICHASNTKFYWTVLQTAKAQLWK